MKKTILYFCVILLLPFVFTGCEDDDPACDELFVMNTYVTQKVYGKQKEKAVKNVNDLLVFLDKKLSLFVNGSDIYKINQNAGLSPVRVDEYTYDLIAAAKRYSEISNGKFDITIAPITLLWGIDTSDARVPLQSEIDTALSLVDYKKIILDEKTHSVFLQKKGMKIDLGGIAKGYIADIIGKEYEKCSISSALVSIGGNICTYGKKPNGMSYILGIRDPQDKSGKDIMGKLKVFDKVVATSGAYERYFEQDGEIYHHILDTKIGYPVESDILSATVVSDDGGLSDFLSTLIYIEGTEKINSYLNDNRFSVVIIDKKNRVYVSDAIKDFFEITNKDYILVEN